VSWAQSSPGNGQPTTNYVQQSINGGAWGNAGTFNATTSSTVTTAANRKTIYQVRGQNSAGNSGFSASSAPIYTTPAAPTGATAVKGSDLSITVSWKNNVGYSEYNVEVWHGTVAGGVTTWDATALATLASGTTSYKHTAPDASKVHTYRVRAKAGSLYSGYSTTTSVQILAAPNKPTVPTTVPYADVAQPFTFNWLHNPVDTTPQLAYEFSYSTDGGTTWSTTGRVVSSAKSYTVAANTYPADTVLTTRVRTWGSATTGGSDGAGGSPWSDLVVITYKTAPVASITAPEDGDTLSAATLVASVGFDQSEDATFVGATLELSSDGSVLETLNTSIQQGITLNTQLQDDTDYTLRAQVQDSNGLWSDWISINFSVNYLSPVPASINVSYVEENGFGQVTVSLTNPGDGQDAAVTISISRSIDGGDPELLVDTFPVPTVPATVQEVFLGDDVDLDDGVTLGTMDVIIPDVISLMDTTPTINGTNTYLVTTTSALGAQVTVTADLVTRECRRAFLSRDPNFSTVGVFGGNLSVSETLSVASTTMEAAGRTKPIGLYGTETSVQLKVTSYMFENFGSSISDMRDLLLMTGKACYRDPSGRRLFGSVSGGIDYSKVTRGNLSFTITETS